MPSFCSYFSLRWRKFSYLSFLRKPNFKMPYQLSLLELKSTDNFLSPMFSPISKVWSVVHHWSVGQVQSKECCFVFSYIYFWHFYLFIYLFILFFIFHQIICVFIIFIYFADEVLVFSEPEMLIRNCQWNCMF